MLQSPGGRTRTDTTTNTHATSGNTPTKPEQMLTPENNNNIKKKNNNNKNKEARGKSPRRQTPAQVLHPDLDFGGSLPPESPNAGGLVLPLESFSTLEHLAQATGGTEKSWYRCVFPFGVISLVIGVAGTGVTFMYNTPDLHQTKVVSMVLLVVGLVMLMMAGICWRVHRMKRRRKKEGGFFCSEQGTL
ncbi:hypothetical protein DPEC_G00032470 [Dallia pectoralis]|uniref:Uncharacterized protein n=1 Tax=Dallia pectoralis TaxID=75939 RepID=A0ACC2HCM5_DALPE|nr:hypothetical protein DPEC_G00032470 [Dallia pectoralis]